MGEKSPKHCAKQGPLPSWGVGTVAVGLFGVFCVSKKAELLGEQKGVSVGPYIRNICTLCVGESMQICAGGETTLVSGGGWFFYFIIKILFVSIVPFFAPLGIA